MKRAVLFLLILTTTSANIFAGTKTWNNASGGNWNTPANWTPSGVPSANDTVLITLNGDYNVTMNVNSAALSNFVIGGTSGIQTLLWSASVTLTVNGVMTVNANGVVTLTQNSWIVGTDTLYNYGTLRLTNQRIDKEVINLDSVEILGSVNFDDHLINRDTIFVRSGGTLSLNDGSTVQNGVFDVATGGNLVFNIGNHLANASAKIQGTGGYVKWNSAATNSGVVDFYGRTQLLNGIITFDGAPGSLVKFGDTLDVSGGTVNFNTSDSIIVNTLNLSGGTLTGSSPMRIINQFNWSGGTMSATDSTIATVIQSQALFSVNNRALRKRTLINQGTIIWPAGHWENYDGAIVQNNTGALIDAQGDYWFYHNGGSITKFVNNGTLRKSLGTVTTTIQIQSTHTNAAIEIQSGAMVFNSNTTYYNTPLSLSSGKYIQFNGGTHSFDAASGITLTGSAFFSSGTVTLNGLYSATDSSYFGGATTTFNGTVPTFGTKMDLYGGTVNFNELDSISIPIINQNSGTANFNMADSIIVNTLNLSGGTFTGNSPMRIVNQFNWAGGTMSATDSTIATVIQSQALFSVNNRALRKRTLINQGAITWTVGHWENYDGAIIQNDAGALIDAQSDYWFYHNGGTVSKLINNGTFRKSAGVGTSTLQIQASHLNGQIQIQSGIVTLNQTGTYANTDFTITNHALLQFNGGTQQLDANSDITGTGAVRIYNGKYFIGGIYNVSDSSLFGGNDTTFFTGGTNSLQNVGTKLRIDNGIVNFANGDSIIVPTYWQLGGTLTGNSPMRVTSECRWESGTIMATDSLVTMEIPAYASLNKNGGLLYLAKRTLNVYANMNWNGGWFRCYNGAIINNYGTWYHRVNNNIEWVGGSLPYFNNYATYIKSTNSTGNFIDIGFNTTNSIVQIKKGTLNINNMSNAVQTRFIIDSSATLQWDGFGRTHTVDSLSSITGAGNMAFYGGTTNMKDTVNISGETFVWGGVANFVGPLGTLKSLGKKLTLGNAAAYFYGDSLKIDSLVTSGTLGGTSPIHINSKFVLSGGTVTSTDSATTITIPGNAVFYWNGTGSIQRRTLNNHGTAIWTTAWGLDQNAVYNNMPGALTDWKVDDNSNWFGGTSNNFNNYGTLRKSGGTGTSSFEYYVNNYGLIEVQSGTLFFGAGGTHTGGSFVLSPGSTIDFAAGNHTFDASSSVIGTGTVLISPTLFAMDGIYNIIGNTTIGGGTINFDSTFSTTNRTTINGGTTNFRMMPGHFIGAGNKLAVGNAAVNFITTDSLKVDTLLVTGGLANIGGNNNWLVRHFLQFSAGTISSSDSSLSLTLPAGSSFHWSGNGSFDRRKINNYGMANWSAPWGFSNSSIYNNMPGATTNLTTDYNSNWFFATSEPYFINYGTLNKSGGTGVSSFEYQISNYGTVQVDSGLTILCYDSLVNFSSGTITGKGTLDVSTRFTNAGTISPGASPGQLKFTGNYNNSSSANYNVEIGGLTQTTQYDNLNITGAAALNGNLNISKFNDFMPAASDTFKILKYGSRSGTFPIITGDSIGNGLRLMPEYRGSELVLYASNTNPTASVDMASLSEDDSVSLRPLDNDTDSGGDSLFVQLVSVAPLHGSYTILGDSVIHYTPVANFNGTDSLKYKVIDKNGGNASAWIYITIIAVNDAPYVAKAIGDTAFTEDFGKKFIVELDSVFSDVDNGPTFGATNLTAGVTPFISNDSLYLLSSAYFNGSVTIALSANDGQYTAVDTFQITVSGVNNAPTLTAAVRDTSFNEDFGRTFAGLLSANFSDIDGDSLDYGTYVLNGSVLSQTVKDSLFITAGANFNGTAVIQVLASDGQFSVSDTFDVMVIPVNDPVVQISPISDVTLTQDFSRTAIADLTEKFTDADGSVPVFTPSVLDSGVTVSVSGDTLYLISIPEFLGTASVRIEASDTMTTVADTFQINVNPANFPPVVAVAFRDTVFAEDFGRVFVTTVNGAFNDPDDFTLMFFANVLGGSASVQLQNDSLYLTSSTDFYGSISLRVTASDGLNSVSDTFSVTVDPVNDAPIMTSVLADKTLLEDFGSYFVTRLSHVYNDPDYDSLAFSAANLDAGIDAIISGDSLYLHSTSGFLGQVRVRTAADDGQYAIDDTFIVTVNPSNFPPTLADALRDTTFSEDFGKVFVCSLSGAFADADDASLTYGTASLSAGITSLVSNDSLYLNSGLDFNGTVNVRVYATDGVSTVSDTFSVTVTPVNDAPVRARVIADQTLLQDFGKVFGDRLSAVFSDIDNGSLTYTVTTLNAGIDGVISNDTLYLLSTTGFTGASTLRVTAGDGEFTAADTFVVNVNSSNTPPQILAALRDTTFAEDFGKVPVYKLGSTFTDADPLTFAAAALNAGLTVSVSNDSLYLTSQTNFNGTVSVRVTATDGAFTVPDTFIVTVSPVNDAPSAFSLIEPSNNTLTNLLRPTFRWRSASDRDGDTIQYLLEISTQTNFSSLEQSYSLTDTAQTLASDLDSTGTYYWRVTASDGSGGSFQTTALSFRTDATRPDIRISVLQGTITKRYIDIYAYSNENLSGAVNSTFTLKNSSGTTIDTRSAAMNKIGTSNLYTSSYHVADVGSLEIQVTAQDAAANQRIANRNYTVSALLKGETFVSLSPEFEISSIKPAISESGFLLIGPVKEIESTVMPSLKNGVELIGTTELKDALKLTIRYDASEMSSLKLRSNFDERKIGIYRVTENGFEYAGGQGHDHAVTVTVSSYGKYVALYDDRHEIVPEKIELAQNYPNPFNPSTTIQYGLATNGKVRLVIYNVLGQRVRELIDANQPAGYHKVLWDGRNASGQTVATGLYIYRLETPDGVLSRKMMLIK